MVQCLSVILDRFLSASNSILLWIVAKSFCLEEFSTGVLGLNETSSDPTLSGILYS